MHECLKVSEVGQIECQTREKKIYVVKKKFRDNFFEIFFIESYSYIYFELFLSFPAFFISEKVCLLKGGY